MAEETAGSVQVTVVPVVYPVASIELQTIVKSLFILGCVKLRVFTTAEN